MTPGAWWMAPGRWSRGARRWLTTEAPACGVIAFPEASSHERTDQYPPRTRGGARRAQEDDRRVQRSYRPLVHDRRHLLGGGRHARRCVHRGAVVLLQGQPRDPVADLRAAAAAAHQRRDLCLCRQHDVRRHLSFDPAPGEGPAGLRFSVQPAFLGLAVHHRRRGDHAAAGADSRQGIRRADLADRRRWSR